MVDIRREIPMPTNLPQPDFSLAARSSPTAPRMRFELREDTTAAERE